MLEDLKNASEGLRSALTRYLSVCSNVRSCTLQGGLLHNRPLELADQIQSEVEFFTQYESQLRDAKVAIHVARNNVPSVVPINRLPQEILVTIFHFVLAIRPRTVDSLSQVCSRWRSISLSTCSLWAHIEYRPPQVVQEYQKAEVIQSRLLSYANLHLSRSGSLPVHLSLVMEHDHWDPEDAYEWYDEMEPLFDIVKSRVQSLQISFDTSDPHGVATEAQKAVLNDLLLNSTRGALTAVDLSSYRFGFISTSDNVCPGAVLILDMTSEQLDDIFTSVEVLHLTKLYPIWTSTAYRDLVDLRLTGWEHSISGTTLVSILRKSPRLRIFHFGISLQHQATDSVSPIQLGDLEVLKITGDTVPRIMHERTELLLSWIHPGKKPLCLYLDSNTDPSRWIAQEEAVSMKQTRSFIGRSNLAELHASRYLLPLKLLPFPMRHLALRNCDINDRIAVLQDNTEHDAQYSNPPLASLYLRSCSIDLEVFRSSLQSSSVQRLVICWCRFLTKGQKMSQEEVEAKLSGLCPIVLFDDKALNYMYS